MGTCITKATHAYLGKFTHIPTYLGIFRHIQAYSGIIKHIQELFRLVQAKGEPCVTLAYLEHEENSDSCQTSAAERFAKIVNG